MTEEVCMECWQYERTQFGSQSPERPWKYYIPEASKESFNSYEDAAASLREFKAWQRGKSNNQGQVEGYADVQPVSRREGDVPNKLLTVAELLRQQHAVCEPDKPQGCEFPTGAPTRAYFAEREALGRFCREVACAWRLLLGTIRQILGDNPLGVTRIEDIRVYAPGSEDTDRKNNPEHELRQMLDKVVRSWRAYEREHGPEQGFWCNPR